MMRNNPLHNLFNLLNTKNRTAFLLFFGIAFGVLLLTKLSKEYTKTFTFYIQETNVPQNEILIKDSTQQLYITLKGIGFDLFPYYFKKDSLKIDFQKNSTKTADAYVLTSTNSFGSISEQFPKSLEVVNISPNSVFFPYDVLDTKKVPVQIHANITYHSGYFTTKKLWCEPDSVTVIGASEVLKKITTIPSDSILLSDVKENINKKVDLQLPKTLQQVKYSAKTIEVKAIVEKFSEGTVQVPITLKNAPKDLKLSYFPKMVTVTFYASLSNFKTIDAHQFSVVCDYKKRLQEGSILIPEIDKQPQNIAYARLNTTQIEYILQ